MDDYVTPNGRLVIGSTVDRDWDIEVTIGTERTYIGKSEAANIVAHLQKLYDLVPEVLSNGEFDRG